VKVNPENAVVTALVVVGVLGIIGFIFYKQYFAPKLATIGGLKGAGQVSQGLSQIQAGVETVAKPLGDIYNNLTGLFGRTGAGGKIDVAAAQPTFPNNADTVVASNPDSISGSTPNPAFWQLA